MESVPVWIAVIIIGVVGSLALLLWSGSDKRHEKHAEKLDEHDREIATLKSEVATLKTETTTLRQRWHDMKNETAHILGEWYSDLVERFGGKK